MAAVQLFSKFSYKTQGAWLPLLSGYRHVLYPATYLDPIPDRKKLDILESEGKLDDLKVMPVKPAPSTMTNSILDNPELKRFNNLLMKWSEKTLARQLMQDVFARIKRIQLAKYHAASEEEKINIVLNPMEIFHIAVENCKPVLKTEPVKKGGIMYQVPVPVSIKQSEFLSMKWLIAAGRDKDGPISFVEQMTKELLDAYHNEGRVVKRKHDLHKLCEHNKAYAHYRWS